MPAPSRLNRSESGPSHRFNGSFSTASTQRRLWGGLLYVPAVSFGTTATSGAVSPDLGIRPNFGTERPRRFCLVREMPDLIGDIVGMAEIVVRLVRVVLALPLQ